MTERRMLAFLLCALVALAAILNGQGPYGAPFVAAMFVILAMDK